MSLLALVSRYVHKLVDLSRRLLGGKLVQYVLNWVVWLSLFLDLHLFARWLGLFFLGQVVRDALLVFLDLLVHLVVLPFGLFGHQL